MELHDAAMLNNEAAVRAILEQQTSGGKFIRLLTLRGSLVNACDQGGATPLHHAAMGGAGMAATALIEYGADISARDNEGATPLHLAAWANSAEMCGLLCLRGANRSQRDREGRRPYDIAVAKEFRSLLATLEPPEGAGDGPVARSTSVSTPARDPVQHQASSANRMSQPRPRAATATTAASRTTATATSATTFAKTTSAKQQSHAQDLAAAKARAMAARGPAAKPAVGDKKSAAAAAVARSKSTVAASRAFSASAGRAGAKAAKH